MNFSSMLLCIAPGIGYAAYEASPPTDDEKEGCPISRSEILYYIYEYIKAVAQCRENGKCSNSTE